MEITRDGSRPTNQGLADWFTGSVKVEPLLATPGESGVVGGLVTFEAGARTAWHTHPAGQSLIVLSGVGWAQGEGGPIEELRPGDVVWFPAGEKHWHGASASHAMSHIAIQQKMDGKVVDWLEHVSDDEYSS